MKDLILTISGIIITVGLFYLSITGKLLRWWNKIGEKFDSRRKDKDA